MKNLLIALAFAWPCLASAQLQLTGKITDAENGKPLPGAHVIVENTFVSGIADSSGTFVLELRPGKYTLSVSFMGFHPVQTNLNLAHDTTLEIPLREEAIMGEEVNITATRAGVKYPIAYSTMTQREIEKVNLGKDIPYLIQSTPSVVVTSDAGTGIGYTGIAIRGTDLTRINVTVNGIPLNDAESQGVWFVDLPDIASSTQDIQIQRGVGTSTNGAGAFGATLNIRTADHREDPYGELSLAGGSYGTARGTLSFGTGTLPGRLSVDGRASFLTSDGYIDRASSDLRSFYLSGGYYGKKTILKLVLFSGTEKTYQAWEGVPGDSLALNRTFNPAGLYYDTAGNVQYYRNQTDNYQQDHYQLLFSQQLAKNLDLNLALFYTKGYGYYESYKASEPFADYGLPDVILGGDTITGTDLVNRKYLDNDFYGLTFSSNYTMEKKLKLTLGGGWNRYYGRHYGKVIWAQYASTGDNERNWYFSTGDKTDFNIFLKGIWTVRKKVSLFADLQYRYVHYVMDGTLDDLRTLDQTHTFGFFNPKAGVYYDISDRHHAWFSFGIANREPSRNNYKDADPDRIPDPERLFDYELGYSFGSRFVKAGINLYYMHYHDQLVLTGEINNVGEAIMVNVPKSYRAGVEVSATFNILKSLIWDLNAAFSRNEITDFTAYTDMYDASWEYLGQDSSYLGSTTLSFSPSVNLGSTIRYIPVKGLTVSFYSKYVGRQYIDNTTTKTRSLDPWFVNSLGAEYVLKTGFFREIVFQAMVSNIFGAKYESNAWVYPYILDGTNYEMTGWFPQAPATFMAGITLRL